MLQTGSVVYSAAGHDKDRFYAVVRLEQGAAWIADGKARKLGKPKCKNPLHLHPTKTVLAPAALTTDKQLRLALAPFNTGNSARSHEEGGTELV